MRVMSDSYFEALRTGLGDRWELLIKSNGLNIGPGTAFEQSLELEDELARSFDFRRFLWRYRVVEQR